MKWLNQISIKVKVMLPICILGIVILLASISSLAGGGCNFAGLFEEY